MNMKNLLSTLFLAAVVSGCATAQLTPVSPADGTTVPTLSAGQKAYTQMARKERVAYFASPSKRKEMKALGYYPQPIKLQWNGGSAKTSKVVVKRLPDGKVFFSAETDKNFVEVDNLEIARTYEWTVTSGEEVFTSKFSTEDQAPRLIRVPGVPNVRDLGGRIGLNGRRVKQGRVIRTAGLNDNASALYLSRDEAQRAGLLTPEVLKKEKALQDHIARYRGYQANPKTFDLKHKGWQAFAKQDKSRTLADYFKYRIEGDEASLKRLYRDTKRAVPGKNRVPEGSDGRDYLLNVIGIKSDIDLRSDGECYGMTGSPLGPTVTWFHYSSSAYAGMQSKSGKEAFTKVFKVFLDEKNYPIDFHCIAGQDRTGAVAFILNGLLGVKEEELYLDWEVTGFWNGSSSFNHRRLFDHLVSGFKDKVPGATLHEKIENYVISLGFTKADIEKFRSFMLE